MNNDNETLIRETDQREMYRLQGRIAAYREAINLREVFFPNKGRRAL